MLKGIEEEAAYFCHPDHLGSVSVVSNHRGEPYERVEYLPFGEVWIEDVDAATRYIPFRFTSKELDRETGLYYYGARYYEPKFSRWMSAAPAGFVLVNPMGGNGEPKSSYSVIEAANWYSYTSNNPVRYVDPTGMKGQKDDATKEAFKTALSGLPSTIIDVGNITGVVGILLSAAMDAPTIVGGIVGIKGYKLKTEAAIQHLEAGSQLNTPEGQWNYAIADFKFAAGEYLFEFGKALTEGEVSEDLHFYKERLDAATEELEQFLYDPQRNPFYEPDKVYTTDDLEYKPLSDE